MATDVHRLVERKRRRNELREARRGEVGQPVERIRQRILEPRPGARGSEQLVPHRRRCAGLDQVRLGVPQRLAPTIHIGARGDSAALHRHEE